MGQAQSTAKARVSQRDATALYDNLSGVYNLFGHLAESNARDRSLELAEVKPGQHVLEVAVGTGLALVHVVRANPAGRNVGIDISWSAKISYGFQSLWIKTLGATSLPLPWTRTIAYCPGKPLVPATGETVLAPSRNRWRKVGRITGATGKPTEGETEAARFVVAKKRDNARGAKGPCCT